MDFNDGPRMFGLPYVVVLGSYRREKGVGPHHLYGGLGQLRDHHAVAVGTRGYGEHPFEEGCVEIRELQESEPRRRVEEVLDERE